MALHYLKKIQSVASAFEISSVQLRRPKYNDSVTCNNRRGSCRTMQAFESIELTTAVTSAVHSSSVASLAVHWSSRFRHNPTLDPL